MGPGMQIGRLSFYITEVQGDTVRSGGENCTSSEILDFQRNTMSGSSPLYRYYVLHMGKGTFGCWGAKEIN